MSELYAIRTVDDNSLQHYGVLGMKWGRRKRTPYQKSLRNAKTYYKRKVKKIDARYTKAGNDYDKATNSGRLKNEKAEKAFDAAETKWAAQRKSARKAYRSAKKSIKSDHKYKVNKAYVDVNAKSSLSDRFYYNSATRKKAAKYIVDHNMSIDDAISKSKSDARRNTAALVAAYATVKAIQLYKNKY